MVDSLQKKIDKLMPQCPPHKELASKKQNLTNSLEDYLKKVLDGMLLHLSPFDATHSAVLNIPDEYVDLEVKLY